MPKRSRQIAAKQAELNSKKRRAPKRTPVLQAEVAPVQAPAAESGAASGTPQSASQAVPIPQAVASQPSAWREPAPAPVPRSHNPYIWPEMKRIGTLTGLVLSILAVLTVVLR